MSTIQKQTEDLQEIINAGQRVREFMDDPAIREVLTATKEAAYEEFLTAATDDRRRDAQALRLALDKIANAILARVQRAELAKKELERIPQPKPKK